MSAQRVRSATDATTIDEMVASLGADVRWEGAAEATMSIMPVHRQIKAGVWTHVARKEATPHEAMVWMTLTSDATLD
jgi:hypothetical protein